MSRNKTVRELSSAAERVLQQDHPNPNRIGCPEHSILEQVAMFSGGEPSFDYAILSHIFDGCYPCYSEVRTLRTKSKGRRE